MARAIEQADDSAALSWLYLVVFGSLIGFSAYIWLLRVTSIAKAGTYAYVNPIVAVLLGWAVLDESVTLRMLLAAAIILLGVGLVNFDWSTSRVPGKRVPARGCPGDC